MEQKGKNRKMIIGIFLVVIALFVFYALSKGDKPANGETQVATENNLEVGKELLATLERIKRITLDKSILTDAVYKSLNDITVEVVPQPVGRENPFAPVPGLSKTTTTP